MDSPLRLPACGRDLFGRCSCRLHSLLTAVNGLIEEDHPTRIDFVRNLVRNHIAGDDREPSTKVSLLGLLEQFWRWCNDADIRDLETIDREHVEAFLNTPVKRGRSFAAPKPKTIDNRLWAVQHVYVALRYFGYRIPDPTQDITVRLDRRMVSECCTDDEVVALREAAPATLFDSSFAVILALAELGATNGEMRKLKVCDVDPSRGVVSLSGGPRNDPRTNQLTPWGREILTQRLVAVGSPWLVVNTFDQPVSEQTISQRFRELVAVSRIRRRGLNINSVRAWRARSVYDTTGLIQDAARFLGHRSLDATAEMIGLEWRT